MRTWSWTWQAKEKRAESGTIWKSGGITPPRESRNTGIVDPHERKIIVLTLAGAEYREHGVFVAGHNASSVLLTGFYCGVSDMFTKCEESEEV